MLKNLSPSANSIKPSTTFTEFSQLPDLGKLDNHCGNMANKVKGKANANEKPSIPTIGLSTIPPADSTKIAPTIGPVQLNETKTNVNAIKNAPPNPPLSTKRSVLFPQLLGRTISKAPKKENAKTTNIIKNNTLGIQCVLIQFAKSAPKVSATTVPINV